MIKLMLTTKEASNSMTPTVFSKAWAIMVLTLLVFTSMFVGSDLADGDWQGAIINGILLAFWVFAAIWFHFMALREQKIDIEHQQSKKEFDKSMKGLLGDLLGKHSEFPHLHGVPEDPAHEKLSNIVLGIVKEVCNGEEPSKSELVEIRKRFVARTGHDVKFEQEETGLSVKITKQPITKEPATKKAPVKKPVTIKKPLMKKGI